jgi:hypothetical protein
MTKPVGDDGNDAGDAPGFVFTVGVTVGLIGVTFGVMGVPMFVFDAGDAFVDLCDVPELFDASARAIDDGTNGSAVDTAREKATTTRTSRAPPSLS